MSLSSENIFNSHLNPSLISLLPLPSSPHPVPLNSTTEKILSHSWFSSLKYLSSSFGPLISRDSLPPFQPRTSKSHNKTQLHPLRIRKIFLDLSSQIQSHIILAINVTRRIYNDCVAISHQSDQKITQELLRQRFGTAKTCIYSENDPNFKLLFDKVPSAIRDWAIDDFLDAYKTQCKRMKEKQITHFKMKFRSKRRLLQESIVLSANLIKRISDLELQYRPTIWSEVSEEFGHQITNPGIIRSSGEPFPSIEHDCRLIMTKEKKFYLAVPVDHPVEEKILQYNVASLDPGVRVFQTIYDNQGFCYSIGEGDILKLDKMSRIAARMRNGVKRIWIDDKRELIKVSKERDRRILRKAAAKIEIKIKNRVKEMHEKLAKFLCQKYDTIIIPEFKVREMARKGKRKMSKSKVRQMYIWSHYKFRERLREKGEIMRAKVYVGTEEWTSKTCGRCLRIKHEMRGEKEYECGGCGYKVDRDVNAARNIMIKNWEEAGVRERRVKLRIMKEI